MELLKLLLLTSMLPPPLPPANLCIHPSAYPSHPFTHSIYPSINPIHPPVPPSHLSILSIHPSTHSSHPRHPSIHSPIHPLSPQPLVSSFHYYQHFWFDPYSDQQNSMLELIIKELGLKKTMKKNCMGNELG